MSDVTRILSQIDSGDPSAAEQLLPLVYDELRKLAAAKLAHEKSGQTLQATALVHEAYLRLTGPEVGSQQPEESASSRTCNLRPPTSGSAFHSRGHFFAAAAEAMRRILVEQARRKRSQKWGGQPGRLLESEVAAPAACATLDLLALNEALEHLESQEPDKARLVKLRFFAGLSLAEAAEALGVSLATAKRHWVYARAWLFGRLKDEE